MAAYAPHRIGGGVVCACVCQGGGGDKYLVHVHIHTNICGSSGFTQYPLYSHTMSKIKNDNFPSIL